MLASIAAAWLGLVVVFTSARIVFALAFLPASVVETGGLGELMRVFWLSGRLDVSCATIMLAPLVLIAPLGRVKWARRFARAVVVIAAVASVIGHFYFGYYKARFNVFFWELWQNTENARLVLRSIPDEVNLGVAVPYLLLLVAGAVLLQRALEKKLAKLRLHPLVVLAFVAVTARGSVEPLPLARQHARHQLSRFPELNLLNGNPFWDVYFSYQKTYAARAAYDLAHALVDDQRAEKDRATLSREHLVASQTPGLAASFLKKKPKHVVVVLMESFTSWVMDLDPAFAARVTPRFLELRQRGIYFDNIYQAGGGTLSALGRTALQIPLPRDFPTETTIAAAHRALPTSLPMLAKRHGYVSRFYYGGSLDWHDVGRTLAAMGFDETIGESRASDAAKTDFGVYDDDLFGLVAQGLETASTPSLSLVLTLSNHPPFQTPPGFHPITGLSVPRSLAPLLRDLGYFHQRYALHNYADHAIGRFLDELREKPVFADTLFVFIADHAHDGAFRFPAEATLQTKKVPMLFYAPELLTATRVISRRGTHIDFGATLESLLSSEDVSRPSFGRSLLAPLANPADPMLSFYVDCYADICVSDFSPYRVLTSGSLASCDDADCRAKADAARRLRAASDELAVHYLMTAPTVKSH